MIASASNEPMSHALDFMVSPAPRFVPLVNAIRHDLANRRKLLHRGRRNLTRLHAMISARSESCDIGRAEVTCHVNEVAGGALCGRVDGCEKSL
jgi:hypothetical protein